ncbi:MAG: aminopeptidase P N-terminal domain-containing protein [Planctomycetota bacterium]
MTAPYVLASCLLLAPLLSAPAASAQAPVATPVAAPEPAPPLSPAHFAGVRQRIRDAVGDGIVLLLGARKAVDMGPFVQDQDFLYATGIGQPELAMILTAGAASPDGDDVDELLVPPFSRFAATWEGEFLAPGEAAAEQTGFGTVGNVRGLERRLDALLGGAAEDGRSGAQRPVLWTRLAPSAPIGSTPGHADSVATAQKRDRMDGRGTREEALQAWLQQRYPGLEVRDLTPVLHRLRAHKTPAELELLRASTEIACAGIAEAMKSARPGLYEFQLAAVARYVFSLHGAGPDAYGAIVGAGKNACVLHYMQNSARLEDGDLIVMDYAATVRGFASDVTRTFPANGRFTDAQRRLVNDVHDVQQALLAQVKPGARLSELGGLCAKLLVDKGYRSDHGPSHHVGLAVHDPSVDVLEPGMVLTVEPGAYLRDEGMGCRIEDTVVVTETGFVNLSAALPSTPDEIEALMQRAGIVDVPVGLPPLPEQPR